MSQLEKAVTRSLRWLAPGLLASLLLVFLPSADESRLLLVVTFHLAALVTYGLGIALDLARFTDGLWFEDTKGGLFARRFGGAASIVAIATGIVGLVTLASSAALGYEPSLQFLQLLSALDIAWATAALILGVRWLTGERWAAVAGFLLAVVCIWSIWRYLDVVGFGPAGAWIASGGDLWRYVLPFDIAAAIIALGTLIAGLRAGRPDARRIGRS